MAKLRAVLMEVTLQTLDRAFGLPPGMHIEEVITEPANRYNRTRLLVVSGTHEVLPEVEECKTPKLHSHIEDGLPNGHPLAYECVYCTMCGEMLHAGNNECMQTWVETGRGNFCIPCFAQIPDVSALDDEYGLADGSSASAASPNEKLSCPRGMDGRSWDQQEMPALLIEALNLVYEICCGS